MRITRVKQEHFRNLNNLDQTIDQDLIILTGENGAGKTSFLEGLFYASVFLAFPPNKSWSLISNDQEYFRLTIEVDDKLLEYYYGKKNAKRYIRSQSVDGVKKKASEMLGVLPVVAFLPQDLNILQFEPSLRREYLDDILLQTEKGYEENLSELTKVIRQRNELLGNIREGKSKEDELDYWDEKLAGLSEQIVFVRRKLATFLEHDLAGLYKTVTKKEKDLAFNYLHSVETDPTSIKAMLFQKRRIDIASGRTSLGPHKDDWKITDLQGKDLSQFLSRGEQRSIMISLKIKELKYLRQELGENRIFLLDELLAELDDERKNQVLVNLPTESQIFITTTSLAEIPEGLKDRAQIIELGLDNNLTEKVVGKDFIAVSQE